MQRFAAAIAVWFGAAGALGAPLTSSQSQAIDGHLRIARAAEMTDAVKAFLHLREAVRLEQLWSGNTLGDDSRASRAMEQFTSGLMRHDDSRLLRLLHSRQMPLPEKLSLI